MRSAAACPTISTWSTRPSSSRPATGVAWRTPLTRDESGAEGCTGGHRIGSPPIRRLAMLSRMGAAVVAEAVGTFLFFFVGIGAVVAGADLVGVALAHGLALAVLVSALGAVSGGHFNPAVTVAVRLTGGIH